MSILTRNIEASTVRGYTLEHRTASRGLWMFKTHRPVIALVEHRRTTYSAGSRLNPVASPEIYTVNESATVAIFEEGDTAAALHTLAHYNAQIDNNFQYPDYQRT